MGFVRILIDVNSLMVEKNYVVERVIRNIKQNFVEIFFLAFVNTVLVVNFSIKQTNRIIQQWVGARFFKTNISESQNSIFSLVSTLGTYLLTNMLAQSAVLGLGNPLPHQAALATLANLHSKSNY
jgi:hypothetical protein